MRPDYCTTLAHQSHKKYKSSAYGHDNDSDAALYPETKESERFETLGCSSPLNNVR